MCGIMGYVGDKPCPDMIYEGLKKLEYRGYDSAGIVVLSDGKIEVVRSVGKLFELESQLPHLSADAKMGMGHTRWATHGIPSVENAHPHTYDGFAVIHNGIIENYQTLKIALLQQGAVFTSETDTEVILHLVHREYKKDKSLTGAVTRVIPLLEGAFAFAVMAQAEPGVFYVVKNSSPLVIGCGKGENFFASDALALLPHTQEMIFMEDGQVAKITATEISLQDFAGKPLQQDRKVLPQTQFLAEKNGYRHFMLKEIYEQPAVIRKTIERVFHSGTFQLKEEDIGLKGFPLDAIQRIHIVGCGTACLAGMLGKYFLEKWVHLPVTVELASEFRYRSPYLDANTLVIAMTQSGETLDTLASIKFAKQAGCPIYAICNVPFSSISRVADSTFYMEAGPEVGVASTKAFVAMVLDLYLLTLGMGVQRGKISETELAKQRAYLQRLPALVEQALQQYEQVEHVAQAYFESTNCLFLGRGNSFPIAMEGALKLKEISYIHAEGYAGGELKHGPIALVDRHLPIVALAPRDSHYEKMLSNIEEVCARGGRVIGVGAKEDTRLAGLCEHMLICPQIEQEDLQSILSIIPLQLFSYSIAVLRGTDVDQPRNLAKSVTVE